MDFQEALRELEVDADPGGDAVRRAYLRKLKTRKPETDPEGFARLRQAYETVLAAREGREGPRTQAAPRDEPAESAPEPGPAPASALPQEVLERFRAEFRALPPDAPLDAPVEVARRAVEALQDAVEPRQWLVKALLAANRTQEALAAYRDAYRQGHVGFLAELSQRFPQALDDTEIELLGKAAPHRFLWMLADDLLELEEVERASKVARVAFDKMGTGPEEPPPPPRWFVQLVLLLHMNGHPGTGRELARRYVAWMQGEGLLGAFEGEEVARFWPLVLELGALPDSFSGTLRRSLARVVLDGHVHSARSAFQALAKAQPQEAAAAVHLLREHAPLLYRVLDSPAPPGPKQERRRPRGATEPGPAPQPPAAQGPAPAPEPEGVRPAPQAAPVSAPDGVPLGLARAPDVGGVSRGAGTMPLAERPGFSRVFKLALGVLLALLVVALAVDVVVSRRKWGTRVPGPEQVENARRHAQGLCRIFTGVDGQKSCNHLHALVALGDEGNCGRLHAERIALRTRLRDQLAVVGAKGDSVRQARQVEMDEAFRGFEDALGRICQR